MYEYHTQVESTPFWQITSSERELTGKCLGSLVLAEPVVAASQAPRAFDGKYEYTFHKKKQAPRVVTNKNTNTETGVTTYAAKESASESDAGAGLVNVSGLTVGDFVVLSTEAGHFGLSTGFVSVITPEHISVHTNEPLKVRNQKGKKRGKKTAFV